MTRSSGPNDPIERFDELPMRIGLGQFTDPSPERLRFIKQLGVNDVLVNMYQLDPDYPHIPTENVPLEGEREWSYENLLELRTTVEAAGLRLNAIENLPISFYDKLLLGEEGRDEQLVHVTNTIRNMGKAGIPVLGYHWTPNGVWRTGTERVRGEATVSAFDLEEASEKLTHGREFTEEEMWENYEYFLREVLPVAEAAGVTLCVHPDDPPVERLGGIPRLFRNVENYERAMDLVPSDNHGIEFCLGCFSEMGLGADLPDAIRSFGERGKIVYVHFRDVTGSVPRFRETFVDEGNYDSYDVMKALYEVGFSGMMIPDHVPHVEGDTDWDHRGRAHAVGYLQGLLAAVEREADR